MDDLDNDIRRTLDDAVDEAELLPNRYQNVLVEVELPLQSSSCRAGEIPRVESRSRTSPTPNKGDKMNLDLIIFVATIAFVYCGYRIGFEAGKVEGRIEQFQASR